jgi:hypothetical protein
MQRGQDISNNIVRYHFRDDLTHFEEAGAPGGCAPLAQETAGHEVLEERQLWAAEGCSDSMHISSLYSSSQIQDAA